MEEKNNYTAKEITKYFGINLATIYRMEKQGLISSIKMSRGQRRFSRENIEKYLKESQNFEAPQAPQSNELFFHADSVWIYNADILKINSIKENSIDLIVTSPPYNLDIKYNSHDDKMPYNNYLSFTREWLAQCYKFIKDDGRFCLNIPLDKNKGGHQSVCADITTIAKQVGFKYHSTIIWNEQNISRRTAWGSWLSASAPYVIAPVEVIIVLYKMEWKKARGIQKSDITKKEFMEWTNGLWNFRGESKKKVGHPAPFPVELPKRCIKLFSFVGDSVLDPFLGSGSTLLACLETGREGKGVDIDKKYCELAKRRLLIEGQINQIKLDVVVKEIDNVKKHK